MELLVETNYLRFHSTTSWFTALTWLFQAMSTLVGQSRDPWWSRASSPRLLQTLGCDLVLAPCGHWVPADVWKLAAVPVEVQNSIGQGMDKMMLLPIAAFGSSIFPIFYNHWMLFMYVNDHWYLVDIGGRVQTFSPLRRSILIPGRDQKLGTRQNGWPYPVWEKDPYWSVWSTFRYGIAPRPAFGFHRKHVGFVLTSQMYWN